MGMQSDEKPSEQIEADATSKERLLPDWLVQDALSNASIPDPGKPGYDEFVDSELEKLVAILNWCDGVDDKFWRNEDVPLLKRIAMTCGEDRVMLKRMLREARQALAEQRGSL